MSKTRKLLTTLTMVAVATTVSLTAASSAQAHWTGFPHGHHNHHNRAGDIAIGAVGGLLVGTIIANSNNRQPVQPVGPSSAHVTWCLNRFVSYKIHTDTYTGFDGLQHRCRSPYAY